MSEKKKLLSGHTVEPLTREEQNEIDPSGSTLFAGPMVRLQPDRWLLPKTMPRKHLDKIYNFKFRPDDLVVMTFPKSGTTWLQEILWTMVHNPDLTHPKTNTHILNRSPDIGFVETDTWTSIPLDTLSKWFSELCPGRKEEDGIMLQMCELIPGRRIIKSHFPLSLLPPNLLDTAKVVYVARNPKDAVVSFHKMANNINLELSPIVFEDFARELMKDNFLFGPYWRHIQLAWEQRKHPNMYFVFYEELKADTMKHLQRLNDFIGTGLTQNQLDNVKHHTSFKSMKERWESLKNPVLVDFIRKGTVGDWKNHFTPKLEEEMDKWIEENVTKIGITYKWE